MAAVLKAQLRLSWSQARALIERGQVRLNSTPCTDGARRVAPGQRLQVQLPHEAGESTPAARPDMRRNRAGGNDIIRYADAAIIVAEKPAGLTTMRHAHEAAEFGERGRRFLPSTFADLLTDQVQGKGRLIPVHRLDRDTSGLVIFARNPVAARHLGAQFRQHSVGRRYLAIVRGQAKAGRIESNLVDDRGDGRRGSGPGSGKQAITHVRVVEKLGDFTLVECRLETGRTHQVRIHLGEAGTPICGETVYDRPLHGKPLPDRSGCPRLALHAAYLAIDHPTTGERIEWHSQLPRELSDVVKHLRVS